jgi:hypothetical protein
MAAFDIKFSIEESTPATNGGFVTTALSCLHLNETSVQFFESNFQRNAMVLCSRRVVDEVISPMIFPSTRFRNDCRDTAGAQSFLYQSIYFTPAAFSAARASS